MAIDSKQNQKQNDFTLYLPQVPQIQQYDKQHWEFIRLYQEKKLNSCNNDFEKLKQARPENNSQKELQDERENKSSKKVQKMADDFQFSIKSPALKLDQTFIYRDVKHLSIQLLKGKIFPKDILETKSIRIIFSGKQLADSDLLSDIPLSNNCFLHAFVSEKVEKKIELTNEAPNQNTSIQQVRGFERMRDYGVNEVHITLQRYAFHSNQILLDEDIDADPLNLINNEEEWMVMHFDELSLNPLKFQEEDFLQVPDKKYPQRSGNFLEFIFGFIIGICLIVFAFVPIILQKYTKGKTAWISKALTYGIFFGTLIQLLYQCFTFGIFGKFWFVKFT